jgi:Uncharacterised protein family (UPF0175)
MQLAIEVPEDIAEELRAKWKDLPRHALEAMALEGYRSGELTEWQVQRLLGFHNRVEAHRFLQEHEAYFEYTLAEVKQEIETSRRVKELHDAESHP